jgi:CelD/BcsL family acetyltransferase involved in cellulose biosynthesis
MNNEFSYEIITSWADTRQLRTIWDNLHDTCEENHPFTSYDWFDCWYPAYCEPGKERIIVVYDHSGVRAIFPGMLTSFSKAGIKLSCFSYAANGHSQRCGVLAGKNDTEAIQSALLAAFNELDERIDIVVLPFINADSPTYNLLEPNAFKNVFKYIEHSFESPAIKITDGWEEYFLSRPKGFKDNLRYSNNRAKKSGLVSYEMLTGSNINESTIDRVRLLDSKSWQYENGTGLFSTVNNSNFYTALLRKTVLGEAKLVVNITTLAGKDISYSLNIESEDTIYVLKTGYDADYSKISPGALNWLSFIKNAVQEGKSTIDMLGETDKYKQDWETYRMLHNNYWLVNINTVKGLYLITALSIRDHIRSILSLCTPLRK